MIDYSSHLTIILSLKDSETLPKSAIFKLVELPWDSPTFPVHSHFNIEPFTSFLSQPKYNFVLAVRLWLTPCQHVSECEIKFYEHLTEQNKKNILLAYFMIWTIYFIFISTKV